MKKWLLLLLPAVAYGETKLISMEDADCRLMKTFTLRAQCEEVQGIKPKASESVKVEDINATKNLRTLFGQLNNFAFEVKDESPPRLILFPEVNPNIEKYEVERAIMEGVYRTFVHLNISCINLSVIPRKLGENDYTKEVGLSICRDDAVLSLSQVLGVSDLKSLITTETVAGVKFENQWIPEFSRVYYGEHRTGDDVKRTRIVELLKGKTITKPPATSTYKAPTYSAPVTYRSPKNSSSYSNYSSGGICPPGQTWVSPHTRKGHAVRGHCRKVR